MSPFKGPSWFNSIFECRIDNISQHLLRWCLAAEFVRHIPLLYITGLRNVEILIRLSSWVCMCWENIYSMVWIITCADQAADSQLQNRVIQCTLFKYFQLPRIECIHYIYFRTQGTVREIVSVGLHCQWLVDKATIYKLMQYLWK